VPVRRWGRYRSLAGVRRAGGAIFSAVWKGVATLRIEFSDGSIDAEANASTVLLSVDGTTHEQSRDAARELADEIGEALVSREEFLRTAGEQRPDGSYVVSRRGADTVGNEGVFDSSRRLERLYERLPGIFDADDIGRTGIPGSRRQMVVRHSPSIRPSRAGRCRGTHCGSSRLTRAGRRGTRLGTEREPRTWVGRSPQRRNRNCDCNAAEPAGRMGLCPLPERPWSCLHHRAGRRPDSGTDR
jgi:hypothetical protein